MDNYYDVDTKEEEPKKVLSVKNGSSIDRAADIPKKVIKIKDWAKKVGPEILKTSIEALMKSGFLMAAEIGYKEQNSFIK